MKNQDIKGISDMQEFAKEFLNTIQPNNGATILCLQGDLGAGKTTFTQQIAKIFNIKDHITSPTFILQKKYEIKSSPFTNLEQISQIIHMDMYRIEDVKELESLGFRELLKDPKNLLIIEWPEKVAEAIPKVSYMISFEFVDETTRRVQWY